MDKVPADKIIPGKIYLESTMWGDVVPESTELLGCPRKTTSDQCKDTESTDMI